MGKLTRITWPQRYSELQRIEELLLCGICYDYMDTSVMTPCSHNYCSLCIRKYLHYKTQCPACFEKTFEKDLHTNRIVDELISYFGKIRLKLVDSIAGAKIETDDDKDIASDSPQTTPVRPARTNQNLKKAASKVETKRNKVQPDDACKLVTVASLVDAPQKILSTPSTSGASKPATIFNCPSKKNSMTAKTLPCPVCKVEISEVNMNKHLDDCLKRETASFEPSSTKPKRKPLPKLVFSLMKDTELRKKIRELGLPTQGDRKTLETRFQRYSTLHNAECDKMEPRPVEQLIRQCNEEEALEKKMLKSSPSTNRLKINRRAEQKIIEEAQQKYLESNKKSYESLISSIKEREKCRKTTAVRNSIDQDANKRSNVSPKKFGSEIRGNNVYDDEDLSRDCSAYDDIVLQDSDSDAYCPLQHYKSVDSRTCISVETSSSRSSNDANSFQTPSKSNSTKLRIKTENSSDTCATSMKNFKLLNDDTESDDVDVTIAKPKPAARRTTKRAKLSVKKVANDLMDDESMKNERKLEGEKLARAIARDFTFDTSSNDSLGNEATNDG